jgi:hypothetical protein
MNGLWWCFSSWSVVLNVLRLGFRVVEEEERKGDMFLFVGVS